MEDKLKAALTAYAEAQSKVLDCVFDNIKRTGCPSLANVACYLPDDVIVGMPQDNKNNDFMRRLS